jgi:hypothetical protein
MEFGSSDKGVTVQLGPVAGALGRVNSVHPKSQPVDGADNRILVTCKRAQLGRLQS